MARTPKPSAHLVGNRVSSAMSKTEKVQEDIQLAEAELHLANEVVTGNLVAGGSQGDLARAVKHNALVGKKLQDAGEELQVVTDLLQSEEHDRQRLEQDFADYRKADASPATRLRRITRWCGSRMARRSRRRPEA